MTYASSKDRYLENEVLSRSPEWLVPLMYEHLLSSLRRAEVQISNGDVEGRGESLTRAASIILELTASLRAEEGPEVARQLASLYAFFSSQILAIGRSGDVAHLRRLTAMIAELHEAWVEAAEQVAPRGRSGATPIVAAA